MPFRNELKPLVKISKPLNINVIFKYDCTIKNIIIKNSHKVEKNCVVYYIPCNICNKNYAGQAGKSYSEREKQHKYNIRTGNESSALFKYQRSYNHIINGNKGEIIFRSNGYIERLIIETCIIRKCNGINLNDGLYKLDIIVRVLM